RFAFKGFLKAAPSLSTDPMPINSHGGFVGAMPQRFLQISRTLVGHAHDRNAGGAQVVNTASTSSAFRNPHNFF
ncbi:MAG: hypothetical protein ABIJ95_01680, partial [Pseudomonadota bacterium]